MGNSKAIAGLTAALSLILAACGGSAAPASTANSTAPKPASPASSAPAAPSSAKPAASASSGAPSAASASAKPSASAGAAAPASAAAGGTIKVGLLEPLTGPFANLGKDNQDGFNLYLEGVKGTIAGQKIQVSSGDTQGNADVGLNKAKQMVESGGAQILMGITATPVCQAVAPYTKQAQVPLLITGNCGAEDLMVDPKVSSPYAVRFTQSGTQIVDPAAAWAYDNGKRKAILITADYGGGLETGDIFASEFILRGGEIVQELHPAVGTSDFGPFLAQLNQSADVMAVFLPGIDGLRFTEQYANYAGQKKPAFLDVFGQIANGPNLQQLGDKTIGMISEYAYTTGLDTPENKAFLKAWSAKYPNRIASTDAAQGYAGAQVLAAALTKVNGNIADKQPFLDALYSINATTVKGPVKLDKNHDVIQNVYVYTTEKSGSGYSQKVLKTYDGVSRNWDRTQSQIDALNIGKNKGKWVGTTKAQLEQRQGK